MSRAPAEAPARGFVLTGRVRGTPRRFILRPGRNRIGCLGESEVPLEAPGVSKQHAILTVRSDRLSVEDLASKNGTFVNGVRIESTRVRPGDVIRLGTVALRLEEVNPLDGELSIALEGRERSRGALALLRETSPLPSANTTAVAESWLRIVDDFVARLSDEPQRHLASSLALLVTGLGARGAALVELSEEADPAVVACYGEVDERSLSRDRLAIGGEVEGAATRFRYLPPQGSGDLPVAVATRPRAGAGRVGLAVWGELAARAEAAPLLSTLLRVCEKLGAGGEPGPAVSTESRPRLLFPPEYVRCPSPQMMALYQQMEAVARSDVPVLILGETGVGKEAIAKILHRSSGRRGGRFVAINCAAIPAELLEAELFGIGKGVATGVAGRQGRFELAEGGTLFLDEIGDVSQPLQAKLLRALEEKEIQPVGGSPRPLRARIVAATNAALAQRIAAGGFRSDLYYRLAGFVLTIPPLRERREDVSVLVEHFLRSSAAEAGKPIRGMTLGAMRALAERPWPGNVRELAHEVRRLVYLCPSHQAIDSSLLTSSPPPAVSPEASRPSKPPAAEAAGPPGASSVLQVRSLDRLCLAEIEEQVVMEALRRCRGNRTQAARLLGISREALRRRLARFSRTDRSGARASSDEPG